MKYRKLRIAWSVGCGILCVLLIVLWVRSYGDTQPTEIIGVPLWVIDGTIRIYDPSPPPVPTKDFIFIGDGCIGRLPIWSLATGVTAFAALPWIRWRFSLRTLIIAITLVAVVLGLIVWAIRNGP